jgi:hypothetical protein
MNQIVVECEADSNRKPIHETEENLLNSFEFVTFTLQDEDFGVGNLFVCEKNIFWINEDKSKKNFKIEFKNILVHATSTSYLYCQLNSPNEEGFIFFLIFL